jgi:endonuclease/exonuclease/phosphatase family metal-dependent hydrolase
MDADFYNPDTCPDVSGDIKARKSQLEQLSEYIINRNAPRPSIIMGDTNSTEKYAWDRENINNCLLNPINATGTLYIQEAVPSNYVDVDRVFYINSRNSNTSLKVKECYYDLEQHWSDHFPLIAEFTLG